MTITYRVRAYNTATASLNKIHDDTVAKSLGFSGGLVPGVDVYAYLCHIPAERWGREWVERGTLTAKFASPVYDGDEVTVTSEGDGDASDELQLTLRDSAGNVCATGTATRHADSGEDRCRNPTPILSSPTAKLEPGTQLKPAEVGFHRDQVHKYLDDVREHLDLFRSGDIAHPAWLLRQANYVLSSNVRLGPWIHVSSESRHHSAAQDGDRVITSATVTDNYERKGHKFVELAVRMTNQDERTIATIKHTAIYEPRGT